MVAITDLKVYQSTSRLGGPITATEAANSTPNNLFSTVSRSEQVSGENFYKCVYFKNTHNSESMDNFQLWLSAKSLPLDTEIKWAFDPIANNTIKFDGTNDYIDLTNDATLWSQALTKFSFSIWIFPTYAAGTNREIVAHGTSGASHFKLQSDSGTATRLKFIMRNAADTTSFTARSDDAVLNSWNHVVCVYDNTLGSANLKIYINGVAGAITANFTESPNLSNTMTLSFSSTDFQGYMKDFRWWTTKALSSTEVNQVFSNSPTAPAPDYWLKMNEGIGNPKAGTKTGTLTNGAAWNTDAITIPNSKTAPNGITVWQSLNGSPQSIPLVPVLPAYHYNPYQTFNGVDDFIQVPDSPSLDLNQFSINAWFRTTKDYALPTDRDSEGEEGMILVKGAWADVSVPVNYGMWVSDADGLRGGFEASGDVPYLAKIPEEVGGPLRPNGEPYADPKTNDGLWHMGTVTHDGSRIKIFLDGIEMDNRPTGGATPETTSEDLFIGHNSLDDDPMWFQGDLDEIRVWNNDLTQSEITALYNSGTVPQTGAIVYENKFGTDLDFPANATTANLAAGKSFPIWIWYHVNANAQSRLDDNEIFSFRFDIPTGGTGSGGSGGTGGGTGGNPPPVPSANYKIAFVGDEGCENATDHVIAMIKNQKYDYVVSVGDHAYQSSSCWTSRFSTLKPNFNSAYGNHEYEESGGISPYKTFFSHNKTYNSFKFQNIFFLIIDTNIDNDVGSAQHNFVTSAIASAASDPNITWKIAVWHHPSYGASSQHTYNTAHTRENYHQELVNANFSFIVTGHNHNWQRTKMIAYNPSDKANPTIITSTGPYSRNALGLIHVISGTGGHDSPGVGSGLYSLGDQPPYQAYQNRSHNGVWEIVATNSGNTLTCSFVDTNGTKYDTFVIDA